MSRSHTKPPDQAGTPRAEIRAPRSPQQRRRRSSRTRDLQHAKQALERAPDIRQERVAAARRALESGRLQLSGTELAEKLLQDPLHQVDYEV